MVAAGLLIGPAQGASAGPEDSKRRVDAGISALQGDLADTSVDLSTAYTALQLTQSRLPAARARLAGALSDEAAAADRDDELGRRLAVAKASEAKAIDELAGAARATSSTSDVLGAIARQAYQSSGMGELSVALQAQSPDDFATRVVLVDAAIRIQGDALARLAVLRADTAAARARLTAVRRETGLLKAQSAATLVETEQAAAAARVARVALGTLLAEQGRQVSVVQGRKVAEGRRLDELQAQSLALQAQLAEIARQARLKAARDKAVRAAAAARAREAQARAAAAARARAAQERAAQEQARAAAGARARDLQARALHARQAEQTRRQAVQAGAGTSPVASDGFADSPPGGAPTTAPSGGLTGSGYLSLPVDGASVSSEFGMRFHPILHYWRLHAGIDFAVGCGTPVHATADGQVISAGWAGGYGNRVVIDHGLVGDVALATTYNHLTSIVVPSGSVSRGQLIGYSGTTGSSTGCHLHFETYEDGTPVNPRRWL